MEGQWLQSCELTYRCTCNNVRLTLKTAGATPFFSVLLLLHMLRAVASDYYRALLFITTVQ